MLNSRSRSDKGQRNSVKLDKRPTVGRNKGWTDILTTTRRVYAAATDATENTLF